MAGIIVGKDIADSTARVKLKIILLGNSGVGKTSILTQYVNGVRLPDQMYTIGVEFKIKDIEVEGKDVRLALWDTAGQERFRSITQTYFRGVQGAILVFDVTDRSSFLKLSEWMFELEVQCREKPVRLMIGNKVDLEDRREVSKSEAMEFAIKHSMLYVETSALITQEVEYAFEVLTLEIMSKPELFQQSSSWLLDQSIVKVGQECHEGIGLRGAQADKRHKRCC